MLNIAFVLKKYIYICYTYRIGTFVTYIYLRDGLATLALMAERESEDCPGDRATRDSRGGMDFLDLRGARAPRVQWEFRDKRLKIKFQFLKDVSNKQTYKSL